jgi:hypothetical protein
MLFQFKNGASFFYQEGGVLRLGNNPRFMDGSVVSLVPVVPVVSVVPAVDLAVVVYEATSGPLSHEGPTQIGVAHMGVLEDTVLDKVIEKIMGCILEVHPPGQGVTLSNLNLTVDVTTGTYSLTVRGWGIRL